MALLLIVAFLTAILSIVFAIISFVRKIQKRNAENPGFYVRSASVPVLYRWQQELPVKIGAYSRYLLHFFWCFIVCSRDLLSFF